MSTRTLPDKVNDGQNDYKLVSQEEEIGDGRKFVALYEREPRDETHQFTPDLRFVEGLSETPVMIKILRK